LVWVKAYARAMKDATGNPQVFITSENITDRKRTEVALRHSEERLTQAVRVADLGIFEHDHLTDAVYWSPMMRDILGKGREEPVSLPAYIELIHPDERDEIVAAVRRAHDPAGDGLYTVEHRLVQGDGSVRWVSLRSRTFFEGEGAARRPVRTIGAMMDITERKRAEEEKAKLVYLAEHNYDYVAMADLEGRLIYMNPAGKRMVGLEEPDDYHGRHLLEFLAEESREDFTQKVLPVVRSRGHWTGELRMQNVKTGRRFDVHRSTFYIRDPATGAPLCLATITRDITELKRAEAELKRSHEQLRELGARLNWAREEERANIAREVHDQLGETLAALKSDLGAVRERLSSAPPTLRDKLRAMSSLVETMGQSVRTICTELRPVVLDQLGLLPAIEWQAAEFQKRTGIACEIDCVLRKGQPDSNRSIALFRIYQEILANIARHADASVVTIHVEDENGTLVLEVRDNGRGITEQEVADPKSLGLFGMRERAAAFGGTVTFIGKRGAGTTVTATMPLGEHRVDGGA
jgi:PAS domain S-box-containing protein